MKLLCTLVASCRKTIVSLLALSRSFEAAVLMLSLE